MARRDLQIDLELNPPENEISLRSIIRSIELSQRSADPVDKFSLIIAHCNYRHLRQQILQELQQRCIFPIHAVEVPSLIKTLYTTIKTEIEELEEQPAALMILGLEAVISIDEVLTSANLVRESFRNNFALPICLWVNDKVMKKLIRQVPDIESWATSYSFTMTSEDLLKFLQENTEKVFTAVLNVGNDKFLPNTNILGEISALELELAYQDLLSREINLEPTIKASSLFVIGRYYHAQYEIDRALKYYHESLELWQQAKQTTIPENISENRLSEWQGAVLFHLALCYRRQGELSTLTSQESWQQAQLYLEQCLAVFESVNRTDLVGKFINQLGEVYRHLKDWHNLWELAIKSRQLHQVLGDSANLQLAQDYGFLAEVALNRKEWESAQEWAKAALDIVERAIIKTEQDASVQRQHQGLYLWILSQSQQHLGIVYQAIKNLEMARKKSEPLFDPQLYLKILGNLSALYFQQKQYRQAFESKQESKSIAHQFGYIAFIGAGRLEPQCQAINLATEPTDPTATDSVRIAQSIADEIEASGRKPDVDRLLERVGDTPHKLTVIYGQSGVGKSSLLTAGLVPALSQKSIIGSREVITLILQVYKHWARELERKLLGIPVTALEQDDETSETSERLESIVNKLKSNGERNLLTVIIFDQFEELFFIWKDPYQRQELFEFLRTILNIPFVKVILSLREDYLHFLLEGCRPKHKQSNNDILNDVLNKENLFYLGNFSPTEAYQVISSLNKRSQSHLETALIDELVRDLARNTQEVRPIELQVVGAQLQTDGITTLEKYQKLGPNPKQKLVEKFLEQVLQDCGPENGHNALQILYLLTDENHLRPLKTRAELAQALVFEQLLIDQNTHPQNRLELATELAASENSEQIDLILYILEKSGLVFRWKEVPSELYQLIHDYLVTFIQEKYKQQEEEDAQKRLDAKEEEVNKLKKQQKQNQETIELLQQLNIAEAKARQKEVENSKLQRKMQMRFNLVATILFFGLFPFSFLAWLVVQQRANETNALNVGLTALLSSTNKNDQLGKLIASVEIGKKYRKNLVTNNGKNIVDELRQVVATVQEYNRFEGQQEAVTSIDRSQDSKILISGSTDGQVKIWNTNGEFRQTLPQNAAVGSVSLSPNGKILAVGTDTYKEGKSKIKLWQRQGDNFQLWKSIEADEDLINSLSFSPDGQLLASTASGEGNVKIWDRNGELIRGFSAIQDRDDFLHNVVFSPDGKLLATASEKAIKIWQLDGKLLQTIPWKNNPEKQILTQEQGFRKVRFNPNGQQLATANADRTVQLWNLNGQLINTLNGHSDQVVDINFDPEGRAIASASEDGTVIIWSTKGELLSTFRGHQGIVREVKFSPKGDKLASAGDDKTIKLWRSRTPISRILVGHSDWVYSVAFSPNQKMLASASSDKTIRLWKSNGDFIKYWQAHQDAVTSITFSPDSKKIVSTSWDRTVKIWDKEGKLLQTLAGHQGAVYNASISSDNQKIASAGGDNTVRIWSMDGKLLKILKHDDVVFQVKFSPDGETLASASGDKTVKIWNINGKLLFNLKQNESVQSLSFSRNGEFLATTEGKKVKLWRIREGYLPINGLKLPEIIAVLDHEDRVESVSFSPDGDRFVSVAGRKATIWAITGEKIATLVHGELLKSAAFSQDNSNLALASTDNTIVLWDVNDDMSLDGLLVKSCDWLQDYLEHNLEANKTHQDICKDINK